MAEVNLSILFNEAFGYKTRAFEPDLDPVPSKDSLDPKVPVRQEQGKIAGSPFYAKDANGLEYYLPVKVRYAETTNTGIGDDSFTQEKEYMLPYPVISITARNTIVETGMTERNGMVKELINMQDYKITIRGLLVGNNVFPEDDMILLRTLRELRASLDVSNPILDIFLVRPGGKDRVVIEQLRFPEITGVKHVRGYELTLGSDTSFSLYEV